MMWPKRSGDETGGSDRVERRAWTEGRVEGRVILILVRGEVEGLEGGKAGTSFTERTVGSLDAGTPLSAKFKLSQARRSLRIQRPDTF
jgi:hypothetical protein